MEIMKLERVALNVPDLDVACKQFSGALGINFEKIVEMTQPDGTVIKSAISSQGLELLEEIPPIAEASMRSFHFRVVDLDEAESQLNHFGAQALSRFSVGQVEEMICDVSGIRLILLQYEGDDIIAAMNRE